MSEVELQRVYIEQLELALRVSLDALEQVSQDLRQVVEILKPQQEQ